VNLFLYLGAYNKMAEFTKVKCIKLSLRRIKRKIIVVENYDQFKVKVFMLELRNIEITIFFVWLILLNMSLY
jgi:hypothetical protein